MEWANNLKLNPELQYVYIIHKLCYILYDMCDQMNMQYKIKEILYKNSELVFTGDIITSDESHVSVAYDL